MCTEESLDDVTVLILCVIGMCTEGLGIIVKIGKGCGLKGGHRARDSVCIFASPGCFISFFPFHPFFSSHLFHPFDGFFSFILSIPFIAFIPSKSLTQVCHFFRNFIDFSPVENFFELSTSYQHGTFFDAAFLIFLGASVHFWYFCSTSPKLHNSLRNKEISQKSGKINSATAASLRNFGVEWVEKLSTI